MAIVLITGIAGFIGSHVGEYYLKKKNIVIGVDNFDPLYSKKIKQNNIKNMKNNSNFYFYEVDLLDADLEVIFSNNEIDAVIHLAARPGVRSSLEIPCYVRKDIEATINILELTNKYSINKLIIASSSSVYGNNNTVPFNEEVKINEPISNYAAAKASCELFAHVFASQYNMNIFILRLFTVYGPRQRPEMAIHKFTRQICNGEVIQMYGNGLSSRDYTYIDDIVEGIYNSEQKCKGYKIYNLGNNKSVELLDLIKLISKYLKMKVNINQVQMKLGDVNHTLADISKAQKELDYYPKTSIEDGLFKFIKWYKSTHK